MLPPLVGVAVKVTVVPAHIVVADAAMLTEGATVAVTVTILVAVLLFVVPSVTLKLIVLFAELGVVEVLLYRTLLSAV